jgi:hypothetical protein
MYAYIHYHYQSLSYMLIHVDILVTLLYGTLATGQECNGQSTGNLKLSKWTDHFRGFGSSR